MSRNSAVAVLVLSFLALRAVAPAADTGGKVLPLPPEDQKELAAQLGPGVVGKAIPAQPIPDASVYFPLEEKALTYKVTAGSNAGQTQTLNVAKGKRPSGSPAWRFQMSPSLAAFINQTPEGHLMMPAVSDHEEGVVVVTTPPNPFVLKGMKPGETRSFSQTVSVNYLDEPTKQDYSGSLAGKYTYVGAYELTVPAGTFETVLFRTQCEGKIGPAHTNDTAYYLFAPGVGVVAMVMQEDAEAFWIIHIDTTIGKVLVSR